MCSRVGSTYSGRRLLSAGRGHIGGLSGKTVAKGSRVPSLSGKLPYSGTLTFFLYTRAQAPLFSAKANDPERVRHR